MRGLTLLGSTGSIGVSALKAVACLKDEFEVVALAAGSNIDLLEEQYRRFRPRILAVYDRNKASELQKRLPKAEVISGDEGLLAAATCPGSDFVISAISGTKGILPTAWAIRTGKDIGLANKETLVSGGEIIRKMALESGSRILPIDSEHSAIFQCLQGQDEKAVSKIILTASGGPFRLFSEKELKKVSVEQALNHPTWEMGKKITVDSSTLMNKGLEVIEAHFLFEVKSENIEVVIHPQSIVHSMVEFVDSSIIAQMSVPDMVSPIQYALTYPQRKRGLLKPLDLCACGALHFLKPDFARFPCLRLAYDALREGGSMPAYMNAANEELVELFLSGKISWVDIGRKLEELMNRHDRVKVDSLEHVLDIDKRAKIEARLFCSA